MEQHLAPQRFFNITQFYLTLKIYQNRIFKEKKEVKKPQQLTNGDPSETNLPSAGCLYNWTMLLRKLMRELCIQSDISGR